MSSRVVRVASHVPGATVEALRHGVSRIQADQDVVTTFPAEVEAAARRAAAAPRLPTDDRTDLELMTIDPAESRDLDQAVHLARRGDGYIVHYAIADLAAFVDPGDPVDREAHRRGETLYGAASKASLHPPAISEDAGSLLPDVDRPAILWTLELDREGTVRTATAARAMVRSRRQLSYEQAQAAIDGGDADDSFGLLAEIGPLRLALEAARGGVSLPLPEQEIDLVDGAWHLEFRSLLPVETWNAQVSLMTGMAAASLMVDARIGLLRVLPPASDRDLARMRRTASALGLSWPSGQRYSDFVRGLDPTRSADAAMVTALTGLLRGSGYRWFDGQVPPAQERRHAALAAEYAHVTAPLRRLADRYALEICVSICGGVPVPDWLRQAGPGLPDTMRESSRRAGRYERAILDLVEAEVLAPLVGQRFPAVVVDVDQRDPRRGEIVLHDPAVEAKVRGEAPLPLGHEVEVTLTRADPDARLVEFTYASAPGPFNG